MAFMTGLVNDGDDDDDNYISLQFSFMIVYWQYGMVYYYHCIIPSGIQSKVGVLGSRSLTTGVYLVVGVYQTGTFN